MANATEQGKNRRFNISGISLQFEPERFRLKSLDAAGETWLRPGGDGASIWKLLAVDAQGRRASLSARNARSASAREVGGRLRLAWNGVIDSRTGAGPFKVVAEIAPHRPGATAWRIRVHNRSRGWTLWHVTFPRLDGLEASDKPQNDRLLWPDGWGTEYVGVSAMPRLHRRYPRGWETTMQFCCYTRNSRTFHLSTHDPNLTTKDIVFTPPRLSAGGSLAVITYPEGMTTPGNGLVLEYDTVVGVADGTWYDAVQGYRAWARNQPWAAPAAAEPAVRASREVHAWQVLRVPAKPIPQWAQQMEELAARIGVRMGVHFYDWHRIPFDVSYPDYFPERKGFKTLVARLNRSGIVTMPYINGRLWDINAASWAELGAQRYAAKLSAQRVNPLTLFPYLEEYGSGQKLAVMCPSTEAWRSVVADLCRRIIHELHCTGIYIDQVAAEKAELCFDRTHGHPPGGGGFWLAGYRRMMSEIRELIGREPFLTTECMWEGCVSDFDALLSYHRFSDDQVPLFPAVYSGLAGLFGSGFSESDIAEEGGESFARRMAMLLAWGGQLGWGDLTPLLERRHAALLRYFTSLCRMRAKHAETFACGSILRPVEITSCRFTRGGRPSRPSMPARRYPVYSSLWQAPDGAIELFVVNPTRSSADVRLKLTAPEASGLRPAKRSVCASASHARDGSPTLRFNLAPLKAVAVRLVK